MQVSSLLEASLRTYLNHFEKMLCALISTSCPDKCGTQVVSKKQQRCDIYYECTFGVTFVEADAELLREGLAETRLASSRRTVEQNNSVGRLIRGVNE